MKISQTVLQLSVLLAMTLSSANGTVYASDDSSVLSETESRQQFQFQNSEDNAQLRHRVSEAEIEQAQRNRQQLSNEIHASDAETGQVETGDQANTTIPSHERDRTRDRDNIHSDDPAFEQTQNRQRVNQSSAELTESEEVFENRFGYKDRASGQGFNTSGSIYRSNSNSRSGNTSIGGNSKVTNGNAGHASGGGNGRH